MDPSALLVSAADKLHNLRDIIKDFRIMGDSLWERFKGGKSGTLWCHRAVVTAMRNRGFAPLMPLLDELERAVTELEQLSL
jgi:GTP pyrophosphokinase